MECGRLSVVRGVCMRGVLLVECGAWSAVLGVRLVECY